MNGKVKIDVPLKTFKFNESRRSKLISGTMLLAAHWSRQGMNTVRIQITNVNKELPLRSLLSAAEKRRK
jgi:hypothetical protein